MMDDTCALHAAIKQTAVRFAFDPLIKIMMLACCGQTVIIAFKSGELLSYQDKKSPYVWEVKFSCCESA